MSSKTVALNIAVAGALLAASGIAAAQTSVNVREGVVTPPGVPIYLLTTDSSIYVLRPDATSFTRLGRVTNLGDRGTIVGIDFRPADTIFNVVQSITDQGSIYPLTLIPSQIRNDVVPGGITFIPKVSPRFTGGFQAVMDFNPVANALRLTGSNEQNLAIVNGAGPLPQANLNTTVVQTKFAYVQGDPNFGKEPEISGGAYTNNYVGAQNTLFYMIDHAQGTLVTIADKTATGSSNTGGGKLQTVGLLVRNDGVPFLPSPTADFDIYTDNANRNFLVGISGHQLFSIDLAQINPNQPVGTLRNVLVNGRRQPTNAGNADSLISGTFIDLAMPPRNQIVQ